MEEMLYGKSGCGKWVGDGMWGEWGKLMTLTGLISQKIKSLKSDFSW